MFFPDERLAMHRCNQLFEEQLEEVDRLIKVTWEAKGEDYDVETPIWRRMPFGDASFAHELFKKADRGVSLVKKGAEPTNESLDQNILDIIIYGRAWLAMRRSFTMQSSESKPPTPPEAVGAIGKLTVPKRR